MSLWRRTALQAILAAGALGAAPRALSAAEGAPTLGALAAARGIVFGAMVTRDHLDGSAELAAVAAAQSRMIVPGNELKWIRVQPGRDRFAFTDADFVMDFAARHGCLARGHTLVWHEGLPAWVNDTLSAGEMTQVLWQHVRTVASRYAGRMHSWDVVNEVIQPIQNNPGGMRTSPFLRVLGAGYVELAFRLAAQADPKALLTINEYNLELNTPDQAARRAAMLELLNRLVQRGAPVHALGIQAHLRAGNRDLDPEVFRRFIRDVASLGLQVFLTELDVVDRDLPADPAVRDRASADTVRAYLDAALAEPAVRLLVLWGLSDRFTWVDSNPQFARKDGVPSRPHPYDADMHPKPMWDAIAAALRAAPSRPAA